MSEVGCDIVEYLKEFHTSEGKAVKARELCVLFNVHEKQLRNIVSDLRQNGEARLLAVQYAAWHPAAAKTVQRKYWPVGVDRTCKLPAPAHQSRASRNPFRPV